MKNIILTSIFLFSQQVLSAPFSVNFTPAPESISDEHIQSVSSSKISDLPNSVGMADNLIINGSFILNQRNYVFGTALAAGKYGLDRWKNHSGSPIITVVSSNAFSREINISGGSIKQIIEGHSIQGGSYTLSWEGSATCQLGSSSVGSSPITTVLPEGQNAEVICSGGSLKKVMINEGTRAAKFKLAGKDFAGELLKAQRYYETQTIKVNSYLAIFANGEFRGQAMPYLVFKRIAPTITFDGNWHWVQPGTGRFSADSNTAGTHFNVSNTTWALIQARQAGNTTPVTGNVYALEGDVVIRMDSEL